MQRIRDWLFIGRYRDTLDKELLDAYNIGAMLQLAEAIKQPDIASLYLPVEDGLPLSPQLLQQGIHFILDEKQRGQIILVACGADQSRSVIFTVAALKEVEGLGLLGALREVKDQHPEAMPHPALWASLCAYYHVNVPFQNVLDIMMPAKKIGNDEENSSGLT